LLHFRIIGGIPLTAHFTLFDLVINNSSHPGTAGNLALLNVAGGHFSRIEYASDGHLPGSLIAEFTHIAREYVNATTQSQINNNNEPLRAATAARMPDPSTAAGLTAATSDASANSSDLIPNPPTLGVDDTLTVRCHICIPHSQLQYIVVQYTHHSLVNCASRSGRHVLWRHAVLSNWRGIHEHQ
jgi:hypothetical protein